jgi:hypothetical protein
MNTNGRLIIISSPPARPHILADIYNKGQISIQEDAGDLSSFKFKTFRLSARQSPWSKIDPKNPLLMLDMAKKILDPVKYMQDIEGECIFASGQDYYNFDTKLHILNQGCYSYHSSDGYLSRKNSS